MLTHCWLCSRCGMSGYFTLKIGYLSLRNFLRHTIQQKYWHRLKNYRPQERWNRWEWRLGWHCPYRSTGTRTSHTARPVRTNIIRTFSVTIHWSLLSPYDPKALRPYAKVWISWGSGEEISGLISLAAYSWNRILRPPGIGLTCVGWYSAYLEIRSPLGAPKTMAQESDLSGINWLGTHTRDYVPSTVWVL